MWTTWPNAISNSPGRLTRRPALHRAHEQNVSPTNLGGMSQPFGHHGGHVQNQEQEPRPSGRYSFADFLRRVRERRLLEQEPQPQPPATDPASEEEDEDQLACGCDADYESCDACGCCGSCCMCPRCELCGKFAAENGFRPDAEVEVCACWECSGCSEMMKRNVPRCKPCHTCRKCCTCERCEDCEKRVASCRCGELRFCFGCR